MVETKFIAHLPASFALLNCNSTSSLETFPLVLIYLSESRNSCMYKNYGVEVSDVDQC